MFILEVDKQGLIFLPTLISKTSFPFNVRETIFLGYSKIQKKKFKFAFKLPNAPCKSVIDHESVEKIWSILYKSAKLKQAL